MTSGRFRVSEGSTFQVESFSSSATAFRVSILVQYDDSSDIDVNIRKGVSQQAPFEVTHTPNSNRTSATSVVGARVNRDGRVISAILEPAALKRGQCFARLRVLNASGNQSDELCAGYVTGSKSVRLGEFEDSTGGRGFIRTITGTNPAAGIEITETVPTNARWRILSVDTINAIGAASINVTLTITDGTSQKWRSAIIVTGTGTELIVWAQGVTLNEADLFSTVPLFDGEIPEGFEIVTAGISADDDYAAPQLLVEEWIDV